VRWEEIDGAVVEEASVELGAVVTPKDPTCLFRRITGPGEESGDCSKLFAKEWIVRVFVFKLHALFAIGKVRCCHQDGNEFSTLSCLTIEKGLKAGIE
jgi:hypothetical protein